MGVLRVIDPEDFPTPAEFNYFVNNLLFFRDLEPLRQLVLWTYEFRSPLNYNKMDTVQYLEMWIQYALMREVQVLRVTVRYCYSDPHHPVYPTRIANMQPLFSQHLITLELRGIALDDYSMDYSGCRFLEDLEIRDSRIFARRISSQTLRRLHIGRCNFPSDTRFRIFVPNLVAFELDDIWGRTPVLESNSMPLLDTSYINLGLNCDDFCFSANCGRNKCVFCYGAPQVSEKCILLGGLFNVTDLKLKARREVTIFKHDLKYCPTFNKLKTLKLDVWVEPLLCILKYAPLLEKLTIQLDKKLDYELKAETQCSPVQLFPTEHLKIVEIKCGKVESALRFKKILIECGIRPEIISIMDS